MKLLCDFAFQLDFLYDQMRPYRFSRFASTLTLQITEIRGKHSSLH